MRHRDCAVSAAVCFARARVRGTKRETRRAHPPRTDADIALAAASDGPSPADAKLLFDVKLVLIFAVGVATLLASLTPWWIAARLGGRRSLDAICCASALSAGVVAGALQTHMLPEAAASFADYFAARAGGGDVAPGDKLAAYPFAGLLCGTVFLVLTAVDVLIVRRGAEGAGHSHGADGGGHDHISEGLSLLKARVQQPAAATVELQPLAAAAAAAHAPRIGGGGSGGGGTGDGAGLEPGARAGGYGGGGYGSSGDGASGSGYEGRPHSATAADEPGAGGEGAGGAARRRMARAYVFFAALSLHGVFDGLSVGSEDAAASFTSTAFAVLSHKLFDGLALGCALYPLGLRPLQRWLLLGACALTTPAGIAAGVVASSSADSTTLRLVNGVFLASASGSFLFISLTELWPSSIADGRLVPAKLALFAGGFGAMAVLAAFV